MYLFFFSYHGLLWILSLKKKLISPQDVFWKVFACIFIRTLLILVTKFILPRWCVCVRVFCCLHSAVSLPDSVIGFWCLNSLAWAQNGKPFTARYLSPSLTQPSSLPCRVHGPVTPDQFHSFQHARYVYVSVIYTTRAPEGPEMTFFPLSTGQIICQSLKSISLLQLFLTDSRSEINWSISWTPLSFV